MAEKRDGVADGWLLFEAWCRRNGGLPIRGRSGAGHTCFVGPIDQTIDPGDPGTVDAIDPRNDKLPDLELSRLEFAVSAAKLKLEQAKLEHKAAEHLADSIKKKIRK